MLYIIYIILVLVKKIKYYSITPKKVFWSRAVEIFTIARIYKKTGTGP